jgi:hypothetical protein
MNAAIIVIAGDPFCKMLTSQIIQMMPYARTAETSKSLNINMMVNKMKATKQIISRKQFQYTENYNKNQVKISVY